MTCYIRFINSENKDVDFYDENLDSSEMKFILVDKDDKDKYEKEIETIKNNKKKGINKRKTKCTSLYLTAWNNEENGKEDSD